MKQFLYKFPRFIRPFLLLAIVATIFSSCNPHETIVNALTEKEANEIIVFLAGKYVVAKKIKSEESSSKEVLWNISVPRSQATESMALLNTAGLPRKKGETLLSLFSGGGLVSSEAQEKIRYRAGLAEQIAGTIRKIDGILDVDIQLSFPAAGSVGEADKEGKVTASVYVKHQGVLDDPNAHLVTKIKRLVASSINSLEFENVTVISDKARYAETTLQEMDVEHETSSMKKNELVKIWSIIVEKDSARRFQTIFFFFSITILVLFFVLIWIIWKVLPLLQQAGGMQALFSLKTIEEGESPKTEKKDKDDDEDSDIEDNQAEEGGGDTSDYDDDDDDDDDDDEEEE